MVLDLDELDGKFNALDVEQLTRNEASRSAVLRSPLVKIQGRDESGKSDLTVVRFADGGIIKTNKLYQDGGIHKVGFASYPKTLFNLPAVDQLSPPGSSFISQISSPGRSLLTRDGGNFFKGNPENCNGYLKGQVFNCEIQRDTGILVGSPDPLIWVNANFRQGTDLFFSENDERRQEYVNPPFKAPVDGAIAFNTSKSLDNPQGGTVAFIYGVGYYEGHPLYSIAPKVEISYVEQINPILSFFNFAFAFYVEDSGTYEVEIRLQQTAETPNPGSDITRSAQFETGLRQTNGLFLVTAGGQSIFDEAELQVVTSGVSMIGTVLNFTKID